MSHTSIKEALGLNIEPVLSLKLNLYLTVIFHVLKVLPLHCQLKTFVIFASIITRGDLIKFDSKVTRDELKQSEDVKFSNMNCVP